MAAVAFVAGASSGLGRSVAERLAKDGLRTYAGARSFASQMNAYGAPDGCIPIGLDVTDDASVAAAVAQVLAQEKRIDVLVNCAAHLTLGACEETSGAELEAVLRTNLLGMARMTRAVLPAMRAQGKGHILQFSSLNGRFAIPFQGAYAASKHAIEGWSEALAMEVKPFGIAVTLVEPGDCQGGSDAYRLRAQTAQQQASPYQARYAAATERIHYDESHGMPPTAVADAVSKAIRRKRPPARVVIARIDQRAALWLHKLLPGNLFYAIIQSYYAPRRQRGGNDDPK